MVIGFKSCPDMLCGWLIKAQSPSAEGHPGSSGRESLLPRCFECQLPGLPTSCAWSPATPPTATSFCPLTRFSRRGAPAPVADAAKAPLGMPAARPLSSACPSSGPEQGILGCFWKRAAMGNKEQTISCACACLSVSPYVVGRQTSSGPIPSMSS